jgi:predicted RNase H-like HicB family nuclease
MEGIFSVILNWDEEKKVYVATVPTLPGCVAQGHTKEEASERIQEAIEGYQELLKIDGIIIPVPEGC